MDNLNQKTPELLNNTKSAFSIKNGNFVFGVILLLILLILGIFGFNFINKDKQQYSTDSPQDLSLLNIKQKGTLVVGSSPPYGPMEFFNESKEMVGIDIDIAREISKSLGVNLEMKNVNFSSIQEKLNSNEIDIAISSMTINDETSKEMLFSIPYFVSGQTVVKNSNDISINTLLDLEGKKIGIEKKVSLLKEVILEYVENPIIIFLENSESLPYVLSAITELKNKRIDSFVVDYIVAIDLVKKDNSMMVVGSPFSEEYYGIATKINNNTLISSINEILKNMKQDGKLKAIENKWIQ